MRTTKTTRCRKCQQPVRIGDWPFCPHGETRLGIVGDDVPGGFWAENGFDTPQQFFSKSAHREALAARGLEIRAKWAGPNDRHLSRHDVISPDQLAKATELVSRRKFKAVVAPEDQVPVVIEKTDAGPVQREELA